MNISCCREMRTSRFALSGGAPEALVPGPKPAVLRLDYEGRAPEKAVVKNAPAHPGMLLARHPDPGVGDLRCPVSGTITDAGAGSVLITVGTPALKEGEELPVTRPVDLDALHGEDLLRALKELGIHTGLLTAPCDTLIVNGLNPDPGILWAGTLLRSETETLAAGLALLRRLTSAKKFILALGEGTSLPSGEGASANLKDLDVRIVPAVYPSSLDALVIRAVTGRELPEDARAVGLHELWKLGRVARAGLPLAETVLTLAGVNYLALLGTPARDLLGHAGIGLGDGDALVFNGPLRGEAQIRPDAGVSSRTYGICVVRRDETPPVAGDAPCIACGECVQICPARIQPDLLSRYAEQERDDKCRSLHVAACLDCGLCTYVCPARRPVLQYLRLARQRLDQRLEGENS